MSAFATDFLFAALHLAGRDLARRQSESKSTLDSNQCTTGEIPNSWRPCRMWR